MLEVDEGDPFNKLLHAKSINNLRARNIFAKVSTEIQDTPDKNLKNIDVMVEEKATGEILVGAGVGSKVVLHNFLYLRIILWERVLNYRLV